jgi:hypothetical protein
VAFILTGIALMLSGAGTSFRRLSQWLALGSAALGAVSLIGYAYSVQSTYALTSYTQMAVHTAALHTLLGLGVLFVNAREGIAGRPSRVPALAGSSRDRCLPYVLFGPFAWMARLEGSAWGSTAPSSAWRSS